MSLTEYHKTSNFSCPMAVCSHVFVGLHSHCRSACCLQGVSVPCLTCPLTWNKHSSSSFSWVIVIFTHAADVLRLTSLCTGCESRHCKSPNGLFRGRSFFLLPMTLLAPTVVELNWTACRPSASDHPASVAVIAAVTASCQGEESVVVPCAAHQRTARALPCRKQPSLTLIIIIIIITTTTTPPPPPPREHTPSHNNSHIPLTRTDESKKDILLRERACGRKQTIPCPLPRGRRVLSKSRVCRRLQIRSGGGAVVLSSARLPAVCVEPSHRPRAVLDTDCGGHRKRARCERCASLFCTAYIRGICCVVPHIVPHVVLHPVCRGHQRGRVQQCRVASQRLHDGGLIDCYGKRCGIAGEGRSIGNEGKRTERRGMKERKGERKRRSMNKEGGGNGE